MSEMEMMQKFAYDYQDSEGEGQEVTYCGGQAEARKHAQ